MIDVLTIIVVRQNSMDGQYSSYSRRAKNDSLIKTGALALVLFESPDVNVFHENADAKSGQKRVSHGGIFHELLRSHSNPRLR